MESDHNASLLLQHKVKKVIEILVRNVDSIPDVQSWAKEAGVSRRWLCKSMKIVHDKPPKIILREVKFEKVVKLISGEGLEASCYYQNWEHHAQIQNRMPKLGTNLSCGLRVFVIICLLASIKKIDECR